MSYTGHISCLVFVFTYYEVAVLTIYIIKCIDLKDFNNLVFICVSFIVKCQQYIYSSVGLRGNYRRTDNGSLMTKLLYQISVPSLLIILIQRKYIFEPESLHRLIVGVHGKTNYIIIRATIIVCNLSTIYIN